MTDGLAAIVAIALLACYVPEHQANGNPMVVALRHESFKLYSRCAPFNTKRGRLLVEVASPQPL